MKTTNRFRIRSRRASKSTNAGYTLLEIILALALLAALLGVLTIAIQTVGKATNTGRADVTQAQVARTLLTRIGDDVRAAVWYEPFEAASLMAPPQSASQSSSGNAGGSAGPSGASMASGASGASGAGAAGGATSSTGGASSASGASGATSGTSGTGTTTSTSSTSGANGLGGGASGAGGTSGGGGGAGGFGGAGGSGAGSGSGGFSPSGMNGGSSGSSSSAGGTGSSGSSNSGSNSQDSSSSSSSTTLPPIPLQPGLLGGSGWISIDVGLTPRVDQTAMASVSGAGFDRLSDSKSIRYYMADDSGFSQMQGATSVGQVPLRGLLRFERNRATSLLSTTTSAIGGPRPESLAPEVVALRFRYFNGSNWLESWDSKTMNGLPRAVEITAIFVQGQTERPADQATSPALDTQSLVAYKLVVSPSAWRPAKSIPSTGFTARVSGLTSSSSNGGGGSSAGGAGSSGGSSGGAGSTGGTSR